LRRYRAHYDANMTTLTRLYPGVRPTLQRLRDQGVVLAVCTNKPQAPARAICDALDLTPLLSVITGATDALPKKPNPDMLLHTLAEMGCAPADALYVGDSMVDLNTAKHASVPFHLFAGGYLNAPMPDLPASRVFDDWGRCGFA
jgi:phosphoglycolate phosphatase